RLPPGHKCQGYEQRPLKGTSSRIHPASCLALAFMPGRGCASSPNTLLEAGVLLPSPRPLRRPTLKSRLLCLLIFLLPGALRAEETLGYYRFPALHGDTIVFAAEGDLWRVGRQGGVATRLTTHPGEESQPAISPDGRTLAFSATYEGPNEVYTMPIDGGLPVRRTFE